MARSSQIGSLSGTTVSPSCARCGCTCETTLVCQTRSVASWSCAAPRGCMRCAGLGVCPGLLTTSRHQSTSGQMAYVHQGTSQNVSFVLFDEVHEISCSQYSQCLMKSDCKTLWCYRESWTVSTEQAIKVLRKLCVM